MFILVGHVSAQQRWAQSHFIRTSIVSHLFDLLGMSNKKDVTQDLKTNKIKRNSDNLHELTEMIKEIKEIHFRTT